MYEHNAKPILEKLSKKLEEIKGDNSFNNGFREGLAFAGFRILDEVQKELPAWAEKYYKEFIYVVD